MAVPARPLRLHNTLQRYDWGSHDAIADLLKIEADGAPMAELWFGTHPSAPSRARLDHDDEQAAVCLAELIRSDPAGTLGQRVADEYGPRLPYLLKILAAGRALSLQVHPSSHQAREGFNTENAAGVPLGHPQRKFHDDQHKPEMIIALTQFEALAGFRAPRQAVGLLTGLDGRLAATARQHLHEDRSERGMRAAFEHLLAARGQAGVRADIDATVVSVRRRLEEGSPYEAADQTVIDLAHQHPGDPGAIASLMLNRLTLAPGE
ncbi:MAG: mannose-6-phosphate isomerase, class I, partial [Promicromonosporaceae bacterium]|nr:mannose-6-phosphate isomerase, class I [Promicromonosporaceae bacterium]